MKEDTKYEVGGQVKISDKWYDVVELKRCGANPVVKIMDLYSEIPASIIQDYRSPQKTFKWLSREDVKLLWVIPLQEQADKLNKILTERYGDPTVRKYNGEDAEEFGMEDDDCVLFWAGGEFWSGCDFRNLDLGDYWMKAPPPPKQI